MTYVRFTYTNWRGETRERHVEPQALWFGRTKGRSEDQWVLTALDLETDAPEEFALRNIRDWRPDGVELTPNALAPCLKCTDTHRFQHDLFSALGVPTGPPILEWAKRWRERNEKIEELLREYLSCPAEWYDARVKYSPVQVDHYLRAEARAVLGMEREEEPYRKTPAEGSSV